MELWDIYDKNRNKTGRQAVRGEGLAPGDYHLVVHIWIKNTKGQYLISKRAATKANPLIWETTGGSAVLGDDSLTAALREVEEELGLQLDPNSGECIYTDMREDDFRDVWFFQRDVELDELIFQKEEVCDAQWATEEDIRAMIVAGEFWPHYTYLDKFFSRYRT